MKVIKQTTRDARRYKSLFYEGGLHTIKGSRRDYLIGSVVVSKYKGKWKNEKIISEIVDASGPHVRVKCIGKNEWYAHQMETNKFLSLV